MEHNLSKHLRKIYDTFSKLNRYTKKSIQIGMIIFLALFAIGTALVAVNHYVYHLNSYFGFVANSVVKSSFTVLAEIIIGCLLVDYVFGSK
ncbi:MAG: hypothetical protein Q8920_14910 [Bacillota bacterium]|nr:hypothetical protein [Bacillota bacterium]